MALYRMMHSIPNRLLPALAKGSAAGGDTPPGRSLPALGMKRFLIRVWDGRHVSKYPQ